MRDIRPLSGGPTEGTAMAPEGEEMSDDEVFEVAQALASGTATDQQIEAARDQVARGRDQ
jgi:cytochrome c553